MSTQTGQAPILLPREGDALPSFDLPATVVGRVSSQALRGRTLVLYLYPKADTSGCTSEARDFQAALTACGVDAPSIVGLSRDPLRKLERFAAKAEIGFLLASDEQGGLVEGLGSWVEKSMYGRAYMGIDRSTFLVDADGRIVRIWRKVKVPGHAAEVMKAAAELRN